MFERSRIDGMRGREKLKENKDSQTRRIRDRHEGEVAKPANFSTLRPTATTAVSDVATTSASKLCVPPYQTEYVS